MGLIKTGLIIGGIVLGLGAIGGVTASVISSQKHNNQEIVSSESNNPNETIQADDSSILNSNESITAESILKEIREEDIVVKNNTKETKPSQNYAFDLENKSLEISSSKKIPEGYKVSVAAKENQFDIKKLNNGELLVNITVEKEGITEDKKTIKAFKDTKEITVSTFKKADDKLLNLLDKDSSSKPSDELVLSLMLKENKQSTFTNLDELNNKDGMGLKTLLANSEKSEIEDVTIQGKLKVTNITKQDKKPTLFTLSSSKDNGYLKLVKTKDGIQTQALFKAIKTVNLLPNEVSVFIKNDAKDESKQFNDKLLEKAKVDSEANGFKHQKGYLELTVKKDGISTNETSDVKLNTFVYKANDEDGSIKLLLGIRLVFGSGEESTSFLTTQTKDAIMLKNAGFKFHIYTRLLEDTQTKTADDLKAMDLEDNHHNLGKYLVTQNYKTPIKEPDTNTLNGPLNAITNENFYVLGPIHEDLDKQIELETKNWSDKDKRNYILFADYSFVAAKDETTHSLKEKVLYSPFITLINVNKTPKAA